MTYWGHALLPFLLTGRPAQLRFCFVLALRNPRHSTPRASASALRR